MKQIRDVWPLLHLCVSNDNGLLRYLFLNLKTILLSAGLIYFTLKFLPFSLPARIEYLKYFYTGFFYLIAINTIPQRVSIWFYAESLRGTLETVAATRLGIMGTVRVLFLINLFVFILLECPVFVFLGAKIFNIDLNVFQNSSFYVFFLANIFFSFALLQIAVSFILVFNRMTPFVYTRNYFYILFSGAYFSIAVFPLFLRVISYMLPHAHGILVLRGMAENNGGHSFYLFMFISYVLVLALLGHFLLKWSVTYVMKRKSFSSYH